MTPLAARGTASAWLRLSAPIAVLAMASSLVGLLVDRTYANETANWAAQATGQDIANLVAFPALAWCAVAAARGSLRAYLLWLGLVAFSAYSFAIYAFAMHFEPLFLVHVAVFGMSVYALIGGLASLDAASVKAAFSDRTPVRWTAAVVFTTGTLFALLWLSELIPATLQDTPPASLEEAGLLTNPVHVLDLAIFLPAMVLAGVLLRRGRAWGFVLAPLTLVCAIAISIGIAASVPALSARDESAPWGLAAGILVLGAVEAVTLARFLRGLDR